MRLGVIGEGLVELSLSEDDERAAAIAYGGDAANVGVMAARMGSSVRLGGRVGDDVLGRRLLGFWRTQGIDVTNVRADPDAATGIYFNEPAPQGGHRFTYWRRGSAGSRLEARDLGARFLDSLGMLAFTGVTLAVSASSARAAEHAIERARRGGTRIACVLNHRPALGGDRARLRELAAASDVLIASREDTAAVFGTTEPAALLAQLRPAGPSEVVLTDGAGPVVVVEEQRAFVQPVPPVAVRNAAGAGDAVAGAYLAARLQCHPPAVAARWGVAAAMLSVGREGCAASYPTGVEALAATRGLPLAAEAALDAGAAA